jgi:hypothetical protein
LSPDETGTLERHLQTCEECRADLEKLKRLSAVLARTDAERKVDDVSLNEARLRLRSALAAGRAHTTPSVVPFVSLREFFPPWGRLAAGAAAALVAGILIGRFALPPEVAPLSGPVAPETLASRSGPDREARISGVRLLLMPDSSGIVEVGYDQHHAVRVRGSVDDPRIQRILTRVLLGEENPGVRLRALSAIAGPHVAPADPEIRAALVLALKTDGNAAVRQQALMALRRYPVDREARDAMLYALMYDKNPGVRVAAINTLDSLRVLETLPDPVALSALRDRLHNDENAYIRLRARAVLMEAREQ